MRITRFPSLSEPQFFGCAAAFVDSLSGELNAAAMALRRLEGSAKGAAFAYEMTLDTHRYGALIVLDRWSTLVGAFGPHLRLSRPLEIPAQTPDYGAEIINDPSGFTWDTNLAKVVSKFEMGFMLNHMRGTPESWAKLGPMLPGEYQEARRIFLEDLAAR